MRNPFTELGSRIYQINSAKAARKSIVSQIRNESFSSLEVKIHEGVPKCFYVRLQRYLERNLADVFVCYDLSKCTVTIYNTKDYYIEPYHEEGYFDVVSR